jgi:hypothetical protein
MKELFDELSKSGITPNGFYILWCIYYKEKPYLQKINLELRSLVASGYLHEDYIVTVKGISLLALGENQITTAPIVSNNDENYDKFLSIFPKGKLPSGKPARVNKKNIEESFKWFFKNYTYDWDTILRATWYYIETYEKANYMYMKNSQYFIRKQNTDKSWDSELANYCEIIINGEDEDTSAHFSDNVV